MVELGLSARMTEFHAAVDLASLHEASSTRQGAVDQNRTLSRAALRPPRAAASNGVPDDRTTSGNYFVLFISAKRDGAAITVHTGARGRGQSRRKVDTIPAS